MMKYTHIKLSYIEAINETTWYFERKTIKASLSILSILYK